MALATKHASSYWMPKGGVKNIPGMRRYIDMLRSIAPRLHLAMFKAGYMLGQFGRASKWCPVKRGHLADLWRYGWSIGRNYRLEIRAKRRLLVECYGAR